MKIKVLIISLLLVLLSGCTVEYNANISRDTVDETVITKGTDYDSGPIPSHYDDQGSSEENIMIDGIDYYNVIQKNDEKIYSYSFLLNEYNQSSAVHNCLEKITFNRVNDGNYLLNTTSYFSCMDLYPLITDISINLTFDPSDFDVIDSNADIVQNNTYHWTVDKENYKNKNIQVMLKYKQLNNNVDGQDEDDEKEKNEENNGGNNALIIILSFAGLFVLIAVVIAVKVKRL